MPEPFRFSVVCSGVPSAKEIGDLASTAEDMGYWGFLFSDHLHQGMAPLPALVAAAQSTTRIRLGTYCLNQDLRNPVVLAKELATVDVLTGGRLQAGLGAGWLESDYLQTGIGFDPGPERASRFEEYVTITQALLSGEAVDYKGTYFQAHAECVPRPLQRPRPPFLIGAASARMLGIGARYADIVSMTPFAWSPSDAFPEAYDKKVEWIRAAAGGRQLVLDCVIWECMITPHPGPVLEFLTSKLNCDSATLQWMPIMLVGSAGQVADSLQRKRERWGISMYAIPATAMHSFSPVLQQLNGK